VTKCVKMARMVKIGKVKLLSGLKFFSRTNLLLAALDSPPPAHDELDTAE
jgi:hypothetical protein